MYLSGNHFRMSFWVQFSLYLYLTISYIVLHVYIDSLFLNVSRYFFFSLGVYTDTFFYRQFYILPQFVCTRVCIYMSEYFQCFSGPVLSVCLFGYPCLMYHSKQVFYVSLDTFPLLVSIDILSLFQYTPFLCVCLEIPIWLPAHYFIVHVSPPVLLDTFSA